MSQLKRWLFGWPGALLLLLLAVYGPFLGTRFIRTSGDEKVYVAQAMEMAEGGRWFVQTLAGTPDYYKGPFHYVALRVGMLIFGRSAWAVLYMNFLLVLLGAWALGAVVARRLPGWKGGPLWTGAFFATCVGVYSHSFASQMEAELAALFAMAIFLLDRLERAEPGWAFWALAGAVGWVKAPLHSLFLGISALLFWLSQGELLARVKSWRCWAAALLGIVVCCLGFLPAWLADRENFVSLYVLKEIFNKAQTGQGPWVTVLSTFGFYLFPWLPLALVSYARLILAAPQWWRDAAVRRLVLLAVAICLPSVVFFWRHPFRLETYNLPVIGAVVLAVSAIWSGAGAAWSRLYRLAIALTALLFASLAVGVGWLGGRFAPLPDWWPGWLVPFFVLAMGLSAAMIAWLALRKRALQPDRLAIAGLGAFLALGALCTVLGEREMKDLRSELQGAGRVSYVNLHRNIWCEWALLNFWVSHPIGAIHTPEELGAAIGRRDLLLLPEGEADDVFRRTVAERFPSARFERRAWKRWRTRGQSETGVPLWREAWDRRDLSVLERDFFFVRVQ